MQQRWGKWFGNLVSLSCKDSQIRAAISHSSSCSIPAMHILQLGKQFLQIPLKFLLLSSAGFIQRLATERCKLIQCKSNSTLNHPVLVPKSIEISVSIIPFLKCKKKNKVGIEWNPGMWVWIWFSKILRYPNFYLDFGILNFLFFFPKGNTEIKTMLHGCFFKNSFKIIFPIFQYIIKYYKVGRRTAKNKEQIARAKHLPDEKFIYLLHLMSHTSRGHWLSQGGLQYYLHRQTTTCYKQGCIKAC